MKQLFNFRTIMMIVFAIAFLSLTNCTKTDDRDQFVGQYSLNATGSYSMTINGETYTYPISDKNTTLIIEKSSSSDNMVFVTGYYNAEALVTGNSIEIDSETSTQTQDGVTITLTVNHNRGTLTGSSLSFTSSLIGNAYYQGYSYPIYGNVSNIAYKK